MSSDHGSIGHLVDEIALLAKARGVSVITAESCTAGALSTVLAGASGASEVLQGGFVVYTKEAKSAVLGVPPDILQRTAVSAEVARAMADGALRGCRCADIAVAVTGVTGPEPDEDGNPVGLAFAAVVDRKGAVHPLALDLPTSSGGQVRGEIVLRCLELLRDTLSLQPVTAR